MGEELPKSVSMGPDPTQRTVETVYREIAALRDAVEGRIVALDERTNDKFGAIEKAVNLLQAFADRSPTTKDVEAMVTALKELVIAKFDHDAAALDALKLLVFEKFSSVQKQFDQDKTALGAALNAAKEAVAEQNKSNTLAINKSEDAFKKQIESASTRVDAAEKTTDGKIGDLKDRVQAIESRQVGSTASWATMFSLVIAASAAAAVISFIIARAG